MIKNVDVKLFGEKGTCNLKDISVVESTNTYISREVTNKICSPSEIKTMPLTLAPIKVSVDVAFVEIEVKNKKKHISVIILDAPCTYVGTGTLDELGITS